MDCDSIALSTNSIDLISALGRPQQGKFFNLNNLDKYQPLYNLESEKIRKFEIETPHALPSHKFVA